MKCYDAKKYISKVVLFMSSPFPPFFFTAWSERTLGGGRDPLGLQSIWSQIARTSIQGVNSVSGDIIGWRTLIVGSGVAKWLNPESTAEEHQTIILAFERLIAYLRVQSKLKHIREGLRGSSKAAKTAAQGLSDIYVTGQQQNKPDILQDLKQTGVIGQIAGPARNLAILTSDYYLTVAGENLWDTVSQKIHTHESSLRAVLLDGKSLSNIEGIKEEILSWINPLHFTPEEREHYHSLILEANGLKDKKIGAWKHQNQKDLTAIVRGYSNQDIKNFTLETLIDTSKDYSNIHQWLTDIKQIETLIGTADKLFQLILFQCKKESTISEIKEIIKTKVAKFTSNMELESTAWQRLKQATNAAYDEEKAKEIVACFDTLHGAKEEDLDRYISALINLNQKISKYRKKSSWLEKRGDKWFTFSMYIPKQDPRFQPEALEHSYYLQNFARLVHDIHQRRN